MKKVIFKGCGTAIVTPFTKDNVNFEEFKKLVEFQIKEGADAIIVCGTTGEASTMTDLEKLEALKLAVEVSKKRIPIIAGTGGNNTAHSIWLSKQAEAIGCDGLLLVTPYYNKTTQAGLVEHFRAIAASTKLPIILYNVPSRTGLNIAPNTAFELSKIENIVGLKEASNDIAQITEIASRCGDNLHLYAGNDDQIVPILSVGGLGVISVLANIIPKDVHNMCESYLNGDFETAKDLQLKTFALTKALFNEVNPIPVKAALNEMGYNCGTPRLPLVEISKDALSKLKTEMVNYGII